MCIEWFSLFLMTTKVTQKFFHNEISSVGRMCVSPPKIGEVLAENGRDIDTNNWSTIDFDGWSYLLPNQKVLLALHKRGSWMPNNEGIALLMLSCFVPCPLPIFPLLHNALVNLKALWFFVHNSFRKR